MLVANDRGSAMKCRHRTWLGALSVVVCLTTACSNPASPPASPLAPSTTPLATVEAVRITPATTELRVGQSQRYDLQVVLGDGIPPSVGIPRWTSSQPRVLALAPDGRATALAVGTAVLSVQVHGGRGLLEVQVTD